MDSFGTLQRERIAQILCAPAGQVGLVHLNSLNIDDFANPPDKTPGGEAQTRASAGASLNRAALFRFCDDYKTLACSSQFLKRVENALPAEVACPGPVFSRFNAYVHLALAAAHHRM